MGNKWIPAQPSAAVVQQHYVNARTHEINTNFGDKYRADTVEQLKKDLANRIPKGYKGHEQEYCEDIYDRLTITLQSRDLTINFEAVKWFSRENPYESYAQMYERAIKDGAMVLDDRDPKNPAEMRVAADDRVTFGGWAGGQSTPQRGLAPGTQSPQNIVSRMMAGRKLVPLSPNPDAPKGILDPVLNPRDASIPGLASPNVKFNPRTKQVFAAVNYGRRPHGSCILYGNSCLVLNEKLKADALYYPEDTFYVAGVQSQLTYKTLGASYLKADGPMREDLIKSCLDGLCLQDTKSTKLLMEAHIFQPVRFADCVSEVKLEPCSPGIMHNARMFCNKWGIQLSINLM